MTPLPKKPVLLLIVSALLLIQCNQAIAEFKSIREQSKHIVSFSPAAKIETFRHVFVDNLKPKSHYLKSHHSDNKQGQVYPGDQAPVKIHVTINWSNRNSSVDADKTNSRVTANSNSLMQELDTSSLSDLKNSSIDQAHLWFLSATPKVNDETKPQNKPWKNKFVVVTRPEHHIVNAMTHVEDLIGGIQQLLNSHDSKHSQFDFLKPTIREPEVFPIGDGISAPISLSLVGLGLVGIGLSHKHSKSVPNRHPERRVYEPSSPVTKKLLQYKHLLSPSTSLGSQ